MRSRRKIFGGEKKKITVAFADDSYDIVSDFINGELESFHQEIWQELNRLKEEGVQARFTVNRISFAADPERTLIYEDGETEMRWREIDTDEFLQLHYVRFFKGRTESEVWKLEKKYELENNGRAIWIPEGRRF